MENNSDPLVVIFIDFFFSLIDDKKKLQDLNDELILELERLRKEVGEHRQAGDHDSKKQKIERTLSMKGHKMRQTVFKEYDEWMDNVEPLTSVEYLRNNSGDIAASAGFFGQEKGELFCCSVY